MFAWSAALQPFFWSQGDPVQFMRLTPEMLLLPKATDHEICSEHSLKTLDLGEPPMMCFLPRSPVLIMGLDGLSGNLQLKNLNVRRCFPPPPPPPTTTTTTTPVLLPIYQLKNLNIRLFCFVFLPQFCCPFTSHHSVCTETLWAVCWSNDVYLFVACNPSSRENGNGLWVVHHWVAVFL